MTVIANNDTVLLEQVARARDKRSALGLSGLVGGLEFVTINVGQADFEPAVAELLGSTGHQLLGLYRTGSGRCAVLTLEGSPDILVTTRESGQNPFAQANKGAKTGLAPDTRLECFAFKCRDVGRYYEIQRGAGVEFIGGVQDTGSYLFAQTKPSPYTGNSVGVIQWKTREGDYAHGGMSELAASLRKPDLPCLANIGDLDHVATRVRAGERDAAILEFMGLTGYDFAFAVYVDFLNSITNVARLSPDDYAQVFTSGITGFTDVDHSGPTERFIFNYGPRGHHLAFNTRDIEQTVLDLEAQGMGFLSELVGSREEGLKQIFTKMSQRTFLVNEYIQRYDGFDGFFTKSNVTLLTQATENQ